jgi:prevent-host-death family protein
MKVLNIQQAKTHLSRLVEQAMAGEDIVIAKAGRPCVQLTPIRPERAARTLGGWLGEVWISPDFDSQDENVIKLFEGAPVRPAKRAKRVKRVKRVKR